MIEAERREGEGEEVRKNREKNVVYRSTKAGKQSKCYLCLSAAPLGTATHD